jgi:hypothetical protein
MFAVPGHFDNMPGFQPLKVMLLQTQSCCGPKGLSIAFDLPHTVAMTQTTNA